MCAPAAVAEEGQPLGLRVWRTRQKLLENESRDPGAEVGISPTDERTRHDEKIDGLDRRPGQRAIEEIGE